MLARLLVSVIVNHGRFDRPQFVGNVKSFIVVIRLF